MTSAGPLRLGYVALTDAAPLIVAEVRGAFRDEGLEVVLSREPSWATARDRLVAGVLDGAHMLAPVALAARLGAGGVRADLIAPLALNAHGAALALSRPLADDAVRADGAPRSQGVAAALRRRGSERGTPARLGVVFAYSLHAYLLRDWLTTHGVDPDRDVSLVVLAPTAMVEGLRTGAIDGACVGAPWGATIEAEGLGRIVARASRWRPLGPDKVLAVGEAWASRNPALLSALLRSLLIAGAWADDPANRTELAAMLSAPGHVGADLRALSADLAPADPDDRIRFCPAEIAEPRPEHALDMLREMRRWGQIDMAADLEAVARAVYRPDLLALARQAGEN